MRRSWTGYIAAGLAAMAVAAAAHMHVKQGAELLKAEYLDTSQAEASRRAANVDSAFQLIYQNLRTLASLPGIRSLDHHAENLTDEARTTFQLIYNNLANSVSVSEVYVVSAGFDPERMDPVTGKLEEPVIMFDQLILNAGATVSADARAARPESVSAAPSSGPPEVEIFEYRQLAEQSAWFRKHFPDNAGIAGLKVPVLTSPEVITCDNTSYITSRNDKDRSGIILSVPFFDPAGHYKGMVSAIILTAAIAKLVPDGNSAIVNTANGYIATKDQPPDHVSASLKDIATGSASDALLFAEFRPLSLFDPRASWMVWTGFDNQRFYDSAEYRALELQRYYGFGLALVLLAAGCGIWHFLCRDMRTTQRASLALAAARDDAKRAEAEAVTLADQLQGLNDDISHLNRDLNEKVRMLEEAQEEIVKRGKLAQLGQLTATIAHELRNPMATVRTTAFLARRRAAASLPSIEPLLQRIDSGIQRCDDIITQLLDFARTKTPDFIEVDVDEWLTLTLEEEAQAIPDSVAITCDLGLGDLKAHFDPGRMRRVVVNLLTNASEAMVGKPGSPLKNPTPKPAIRITSRLSERGIEFAVSDNGPGMDAETIAKVREPLFTTKNFGTGLGVPAVERILELHGGGLDIDAALGRGATFTAWFPVNQSSAQAA